MVTVDAGKTVTLEANLACFSIVQLARTGTVSLKRRQQLLEVSAKRLPHIRVTPAVGALHHHITSHDSMQLQRMAAGIWRLQLGRNS